MRVGDWTGSFIIARLSTCGMGKRLAVWGGGVRHGIGSPRAGLLSEIPARTRIIGHRAKTSKTPPLG